MFDPTLRTAWPGDLPVCLPGRECVDESPLAAHVINATSALTPASSAVAAGYFAVLSAALVLVGLGLRLQWRGSGVRPWLAALVAALLLVGFVTVVAIGGRFAAMSAIYSDLDGQPAAPEPASLAGSWPSVLFAGYAMVVLGAVGLLSIVSTAVLWRHRDGRT